MYINETEIRVIFGDTDAMGIVYNANYIKWFEIGRNEYLRALDFPYSQLEKEGVWMPVTAVTCDYKSPSRYDDVLVIRSWIEEIKAASLIIAYEVVNKETGKLCVCGRSKHAVTDKNLKPIRLKKEKPEIYDRVIKAMKEK